MADLKISQLTALTAAGAVAADVLPVVDTSATTTKKIGLGDVAEFVSASSAITTLLAGKQDVVSGVDSTEIGYLNGVTSAIQTQLDGKVALSTVDAKGDLIVATADNTVTRLAVGGTNDHVLMVDSSTATGVKWAAIPSSSPVWDDDQNILANAVFG